MIDEYGFTAIKLKGGVLPPDEEMKAIEALHDAFPNHPLRLDPNAAWTTQTSIKVASGLAGILEYLAYQLVGEWRQSESFDRAATTYFGTPTIDSPP